MNTIIEMDNVSKKFGEQTALKDISFKVNEGEIFGFLGPSGAGKTTTINILTGQEDVTSGKAILLNTRADKITTDIYSQIGILTDKSGLYKQLTCYQNLKIFAEILGVEKNEIERILKRVGLTEAKKKKVAKLSTGMKQRLVLARALLHNPKVLFLDEPTSGLDPSTTLEIHDLLLSLKAQGTTFFLTTHNMDEATKLCDTVALLNEGVIAEMGSPKELSIKHNKKKTYYVLTTDGESLEFDNSSESAKAIEKLMIQDKIETLHSSEPNLEDVFLNVTGRDLA